MSQGGQGATPSLYAKRAYVEGELRDVLGDARVTDSWTPRPPYVRSDPPPLPSTPPASALSPLATLHDAPRSHHWADDFFDANFLRLQPRLSEVRLHDEVEFIEESLALERGASVLDLACGSGQHAIRLGARGYDVLAFDVSAVMLERASEAARAANARLNMLQGDMRDMAFVGLFDGIYCWNSSFGFFDDEGNAQVIARMHRALKRGGRLLIDVVNRDYFIRQSPSLAWFEGEGCICLDEMQIDSISSRMRVKRTMNIHDGRTCEREYSMRLYSLHELGRLLHAHGFRVTEASGLLATRGVFFGAYSPSVIITAEKR